MPRGRPKLDHVTRYARAVDYGKILAGPFVRAACRRHLDDLERRNFGYRFDREAVARVLDFFSEILCLNGGEYEGLPFHPALWQAFILGSLFGWLDIDGARRFRVAYIEAGKGNGKSPLSAGIGIYTLIADREARAEVYAAASKRDQAMVLFRDAVAMVDLSPEVRAVVRQIGGSNVWNLIYGDSFMRAISSDDGQSGPRPHCALVDEIHEHKDDIVIEMLRAGFKGRRQPLLFMITNSGTDRTSVCYRYHDYAVRVAQQLHRDERFFGYVCALDEDDEPFDSEACWTKTNPNLGVSIKPDYIRGQVLEAKGMPAKESVVRRLSFCQWTDAATPWISGEAWRACERDDERSVIEIMSGLEVYLGVDLSVTTDLSALVAVGILPNELHDAHVRDRARALELPEDLPELVAAAEFWTPGDTLNARAARDRVPYDVWVREGYLNAVPGQTLDYAPIAERVIELCAALNVRTVAFDRYKIKYLQAEMGEAGYTLPLVEHPQGFLKPKDSPLWMPESINQLEAAILAARLRVKRNPVLTWNAASAVIETDRQQNRIFTKRKSLARIDGVVGLAMGVGAAIARVNPAWGESPVFGI
jgi:phage terminase large subunit-like protein